MTNEDFIKYISKSGIKHTIIGLCIFAFGSFIIWLTLSGIDTSSNEIGIGGKIVLWVLAALCLLFGFMLVYMPVKTSSQIKNGKHPLVNAVNQNDNSYLIWIYEHVVQVKGGGSNHQVFAYGKEGRRYTIEAKKNNTQEIINYLSAKFPQAAVGYTKEIESEIAHKIKAAHANN